jgi:hypothetical protein
MTHDGIIHCGGGGELLGTITIKIYDHSAFNVAVASKPEGLAAAGLKPREVTRFTHMVSSDVHKWYEWLEQRGVEVHYHEPHPENFPPA